VKLIRTFLFVIKGLVKASKSDDGFCSAPSIVESDEKTNPIYWKATNPTLSPSHLQGKCFLTASCY